MMRRQVFVGLLMMMVVGVLVVADAKKTTWDQLDDYSFERYIDEFNRHYTSIDEEASRRAVFESRLVAIRAHNRDASKTWKQGVNHLTDRTDAEIRSMLGYNKGVAANLAATGRRRGLEWESQWTTSEAAPASIDWRDQGIISPVKDQGRCGSCWTFGASESIESAWAMAHNGQLPVLSEQQILDCIPNPDECGGTGGCQGGTAELVYLSLMSSPANGPTGLASEWTYPYRSYHGQAFPCMFNTTTTPVAANVVNYVVLPPNKYEPVLEALATKGPLVINVDASSWHAYETGVFDGCNQTDPDINHVVQLVGYGTDMRQGDYWLVRNSWSPAWGELGYIRVKRRSTPVCGIDHKPQDGTGCKGGPPSVVVCGECGLLYDVSYPIVSVKGQE